MAVNGSARQQFVMARLISHGLDPKGAAADVGNGCGESGVNLDSTFDRGAKADHGSGGYHEWRDSAGAPRKSRLGVFADERGPNLRSDLGVQCDYTISELSQYFPALYQQLKNPGARSIANLTANYCWIYENPNRAEAGLDNRIAHAQEAYDTWMAAQAEKPQTIPAAPAPVPARVPLPPIPSQQMPPAPTTTTLPRPSVPTVDATTAGRQSAILTQLLGMQQAYLDQIVALEKEKSVIDAAVDTFTGITVPPPSPPPQIEGPSAMTPIPAPVPTSSWVTAIFGTSPVTSIFGTGGLLAAGAAVYTSIKNGVPPDPTQLAMLFGMISTAIGLLKAKDSATTGGTVASTSEAAVRIANQ